MRMLLIGLGAAAVIACSSGGDWVSSYADCLWENESLRALSGDESRDAMETRLRRDITDPDTEREYRAGYSLLCGGK